MVEYKKLLDAIVGSLGTTNRAAGAALPTSEDVGQFAGGLVQKTRALAGENPVIAPVVLAGIAGLFFSGRKRGLSANLARLGGLAAIGGLAYRAIQGITPPSPAATAVNAVGLLASEAPAGTRFHAASQTDDDALLLLRTMIAAASADGMIDERERARIVGGMNQAGIDPQSTQWLQDELESPADIDALSESVNDRETAAQVYAAARLTIDPDTLQEREFLRRLADALDLDSPLVKDINSEVAKLRE